MSGDDGRRCEPCEDWGVWLGGVGGGGEGGGESVGVDAGVAKASEFAREWDLEEGTGDFASFLGLSCNLSPPSILSGDCTGEFHIIKGPKVVLKH